MKKKIDTMFGMLEMGYYTGQEVKDELLDLYNVSNSLSGFRKWQKENWKDIYLMSDEFMIRTYLDTL